MASGATEAGTPTGGSGASPSASFQDASAGRIKVATRPGGVIAAATASAPSPATERLSSDVRTQSEKGHATPSTSEVSGASYCLWYVAWSPTMLTMGVLARRALCT